MKQIQYILIKTKILQNRTLYIENSVYALEIESYRVFLQKRRFFLKIKKVSDYKEFVEVHLFAKKYKTQDIGKK